MKIAFVKKSSSLPCVLPIKSSGLLRELSRDEERVLGRGI